MVRWAPGGLGDETVETQCRQIQFVDERFNNPDRVVLRHVVIQTVREQRSLPPVLAFHKTFHPASPNSRTLNYHVRTFSHALDPFPPLEGCPTTACNDCRQTLCGPPSMTRRVGGVAASPSKLCNGNRAVDFTPSLHRRHTLFT